MKFFEFQFNPQQEKKEILFDSFCFQPQTKKEEHLGCLYLIGELKNILPGSQNIFSKLVKIIKNSYYAQEGTPQERFKEGLDKANNFLKKEIKKENVNWIGNLSFAALALTPKMESCLTRAGNLKIFLQRNKELFDIGENVESSSSERLFPTLIEGSFASEDKVFLMTGEVFRIFFKEDILEKLAEAKNIGEIKKIIKEKRKALKDVLGSFLVIVPEKRNILTKKIYFPALPKISFLSTLSSFWKNNLLKVSILIILLLLGWLIFK